MSQQSMEMAVEVDPHCAIAADRRFTASPSPVPPDSRLRDCSTR